MPVRTARIRRTIPFIVSMVCAATAVAADEGRAGYQNAAAKVANRGHELLTAKAIRMLSHNRKGYYMMVEGGQIDQGHHAGNAYRALTDTVALSGGL